MPTQVSVRSSSRVSRSQSIFLIGSSGSARCAATATVNEFTTANTTAQATAVSTTEGRVSQAREAVSVAKTAFGMARGEEAEVAAPASPSAAERDNRR